MPTTNPTSSPVRRLLPIGVAAVLVILTLVTAGCQRSAFAVRESGERAYAEGDYALAAAEFEDYLDRKPGNPHVTHQLGKSYLKLNRTAEARERLLVAYSMRPEDDEVFESLCEGLFADRKLEELNRVLRQRAIDRGRMTDYLLIAEYAERTGDRDEAQRALLTAAKVDGGFSLEPQLELAKLYIRAGDRERAIERLRMAYFVEPTNAEVVGLAAQMGEIVGPSFGQVPAER
ncbi:MAG: tetratricopeptide repeat protein [Phycisphaeraceae bacterium]|nr:tetratricopeptide repeat protein [Phycisphaeraceae bacterium]